MEKQIKQIGQIRKKYAARGSRSQKSVTIRIDTENIEHIDAQPNKGRYINQLIAEDRAKATWAVRIFDKTANTPGHESQAVVNWVNIASLEIRDCNDMYGMSRYAAEQLLNELQAQIESEGLEWAEVELDRAPYSEE